MKKQKCLIYGNSLDKDFSETLWGKELLKDLEEEIQDNLIVLNEVLNMLNNDIDLEPFYQTIQSDIKQLSILEKSF